MDDRFVGAWILVAARYDYGEKAVYPIGEHPVGLLTITENGFFSVQLSTADRERFATENRLAGSAEQKAAAFDTFLAYAGMTRIEGDRLVTSVMLSLFPNWTGGEQVRNWRFDGEHLVLSGAMTYGEEKMTFELSWRKME